MPTMCAWTVSDILKLGWSFGCYWMAQVWLTQILLLEAFALVSCTLMALHVF